MRGLLLGLVVTLGLTSLAAGCGSGGDEGGDRASTGGRPALGGNGNPGTGGIPSAHAGRAGVGGTQPTGGMPGTAAGGADEGLGGAGGEAFAGRGPANGGSAVAGGPSAIAGGPSSSQQSCADAFTAPLIDFENVQVVTPIGLVGGGGTEIVGRSYVFPRPEIADAVPLYAPTDMKLIGGVRYMPPGAPEDYHPDWALAFAPDCSSSVLIELYHVKDVVPELLEALGDEVAMSSAWRQTSANVHFEAGDEIGEWVRGPTSVAFDFIVSDKAVDNEFASPARYAASNILNVICPYRYYTPELREQFESLLGAPGGGPIAGTQCGSVAIDEPGALAGQWFLDPDPVSGRGILSIEDGYGNPHPIALNPDHSIVFGNVGASIQGFRLYEDAPTWRDPRAVDDGHCYQLGQSGSPAGYLYYEVISDFEMRLFYASSGECPDTMPAGGRTYYR